MGLNGFTAGMIHQMRSGKSYLKAHPNWGAFDPDKSCTSWLPEDETFTHAILSFPKNAQQRSPHLPGVVSVGPQSDIWTSQDLIVGLANYIRATSTGFLQFVLHQEQTPHLSSGGLRF